MDLIGALASVNKAGAGGGWDISTATYNGTPRNIFITQEQETQPRNVFFKPDGTKMYVIGAAGDDVNEYDLSSAYDMSTASYLQNFSVASQEGAPTAIFFKPDGTKMYIIGAANDNVNEYTLSSAWDVSTASYVQSFSTAAQEGVATGIFFKPDGTKMYIVGFISDRVSEYNLSTAWNISTASYLQNFSVSSQDGTPYGLFFKSDGTKMYVSGGSNNAIYEYNLSSAWNVTTASYVQSFSIATQVLLTTLSGLFFSDDGTKTYIVGQNGTIFSYDLSSAWDISTASFTYPTTDYFLVTTEEVVPQDLFFKPDGTKMYVLGSAGDDVNEYSLSSAWDISTASYVQNFSVASQELTPTALFFKSDGTKMYVVGNSNDTVYEYNLSSAWDVSTASYLQSFSVATEETFPSGLFFKDDGTKMYVVGLDGDDVNEYDLSSAWDVSTASYVQNFSVASQETSPTGLFFKPDGTKMYVIGFADYVNEYNLSTAWNISTASYVQNFSVAGQETSPTGLFFKGDGIKMYMIGFSGAAIWSYDLT